MGIKLTVEFEAVDEEELLAAVRGLCDEMTDRGGVFSSTSMSLSTDGWSYTCMRPDLPDDSVPALICVCGHLKARHDGKRHTGMCMSPLDSGTKCQCLAFKDSAGVVRHEVPATEDITSDLHGALPKKAQSDE